MPGSFHAERAARFVDNEHLVPIAALVRDKLEAVVARVAASPIHT
jgi:hypothetical protein